MVQNIVRDFFEMDSVFFLNFGFSKSYGGGQFCLGGAIMISCSQGPLTVLAVENKSLVFVSGRRCRAFHYFVVLHQGSKINYL